jgi:hypothetical protein
MAEIREIINFFLNTLFSKIYNKYTELLAVQNQLDNATFLALKFVASSDESIFMILVLACWQLRIVRLKTLSF